MGYGVVVSTEYSVVVTSIQLSPVKQIKHREAYQDSFDLYCFYKTQH